MKPSIGRTEIDPVSVVLETGYSKFSSPSGINGLCKELAPDKLQVLAVDATKPGTGQFREFMKQIKSDYPNIEFLFVDNITLRCTLHRYGFTEFGYEETHLDGKKEWITGFRWTLIS